MKSLIFEPTLMGHHIEYLHNIYMGLIAESTDDEVVIAVPADEWIKMKDLREWPESERISWYLMPPEELRDIKRVGLNIIRKCWLQSRYIARLAKKLKVSKVLLIDLAGVIPFLPWMLPSRVKVSGIIYKIYLYRQSKTCRSFVDKIRYRVMAHNRSVGKVFILNDPASAAEMNRLYLTDRFVYLPDPVPVVDKSRLKNLREELGIPSNNLVFLHFGGLGVRKGTLQILNAISGLPEEKASKMTFIFAGRVNPHFQEAFNKAYEPVKNGPAQVIVMKGFFEDEYLHSLCISSDCLLVPYLETDLSSGVIGYGAVHNIPVIGPSTGLLGNLIRNNRLGSVMADSSVASLTASLESFTPYKTDSEYGKRNTIASFVKVILDSF